jgi:uncharacterized protein YsxB (DUF464 family)
MIQVSFLINKDGEYLGFDIEGHSGYSEQGTDIVCAAVTSVSLMVANTVTEVIHADALAKAEDGYIYLRINPKDTKNCRDIFCGLKLHLCSLEEQYSDFIHVNYLEV